MTGLNQAAANGQIPNVTDERETRVTTTHEEAETSETDSTGENKEVYHLIHWNEDGLVTTSFQYRKDLYEKMESMPKHVIYAVFRGRRFELECKHVYKIN